MRRSKREHLRRLRKSFGGYRWRPWKNSRGMESLVRNKNCAGAEVSRYSSGRKLILKF